MADVAQTFIDNSANREQQALLRQQRLAEILQQQAFQPDQKFSYAGIEAPPSAAAALAKGLQGGIAGYLQGRALKGQDDLLKKTEAREERYGADLAKALAAGTEMREGPRPSADFVGPMPEKMGGYEGIAAALQGINNPDVTRTLGPQMAMAQIAQQQAGADRAAKLADAKELRSSPEWTKPAVPVPGRDVPYSPEVAGQLTDIAGARAAAGRETPAEAAERARIIADANPTNDQRLAAGFADRMTAAEQQLSGLEKKGYDPTNLGDRAAGVLPSAIANFATSPEGQKWRTAQENWVRANLRKESGAVIGEEEMQNEINNYFASPGASPDAIAQKAELRKRLTENMQQMGAGAYKSLVSTRASEPKPDMSPDDKAAFDWAKANAADPRAAAIMQKLGAR